MIVTITDVYRLINKVSQWYCSLTDLQLYAALGELILQNITAITLYLISIFYLAPKVGLSEC